MLQDLDKTLQVLLTRELPEEFVRGEYPVSVSFMTPDESFPPQSLVLPAVNLFLFEVHENRGLRSCEPQLERQDDGSVRKRPAPARVDCHYLITVYARDGVPNPELYEHHLLGAVLRVLLCYRQLPAELVQGSLKDHEPPVRARALEATSRQYGLEVWHALKGKPRATLHYVLTLSLDLRPSEEMGHVVQEVGLS
ncbi:hypothetical protein Q664_00245 [Archangium violaceum Cb vi76]|uniref:Pvc16 N-terminal domain-containing protein n=1 Tax=Archangium violaceum Cb vi76 TaxID=1406225 RepID=A0A084T299_9BACT|nr:hypothetical protein Q664_00245 [Archangium violaceum Cb vi76]